MTSIPVRKRRPLRKICSRLLHRYFLATRGLTLGVRAVVRRADGAFLLVRHTYAPGWHFPGGGVEHASTVTQALADEIKQETGLTLIGRPRLQGIFLNTRVSQHDHVLVYLCETSGEAISKPRSLEIAECRYFAPEALPEDVNRGTERRIAEIIEGQEPAEIW